MPSITKDGVRYYNIDGVLYPSVTSVLNIINKPFLKNWIIKTNKEKMQNLVLKECMGFVNTNITADRVLKIIEESMEESTKVNTTALDVGKDVHLYVEKLIKNETTLDKVPKEYETPIKAFIEWKQKYEFSPLHLEREVYSKKYGYAGTADAIGIVNGELMILDWKTSKILSDDYILQVAAYAKAWTEMTGTPINKGMIVKLSKEQYKNYPILEVKEVNNIDKHFDVFLSTLNLWKWKQEIEMTKPPWLKNAK